MADESPLEIDWQVTREDNRWVARGYDAEYTKMHVIRAYWRLHLGLKMRALGRFL